MTRIKEKKNQTKPAQEKQDAVPEHQLRDREELFCREIVLGKTNAKSYLCAGYKANNKATANVLAHRLLRKDYIKARLAVLRAESAERYKLTPNNILFQTGAILNADIRNYTIWGPNGVTLKASSELTDEQAAAVEEVSETITKDGGTVRFKLHSKTNSQNLGAKLLGMVIDKQEISGPGGDAVAFTDLDRATKLQRLIALAKKKAFKK